MPLPQTARKALCALPASTPGRILVNCPRMEPPPLALSQPVTDLPGLGPVRAKALERLGLLTVGDLLSHYPKRYEDRRQFEHFPTQAGDKPVCVCGVVVATSTKRLRGRQMMFEATLQEPERHALSSLLTVRWFNAYFVQKIFAAGQRAVIYGKPKARGAGVVIDHPEFEIIEDEGDEENLIHLKRITPVYATTEGLSQKTIRTLIYRTLAAVDLSTLPDILPAGLDPTPRAVALRNIHFPDDEPSRESARRHLVMSEFFGLQMILAARRARAIALTGESHCGPGKLLERFHDSLPFGLTRAQWRAIGEIRADLATNHPMNRLLQGDVGAGKTLVALSAMLLAVEAGYQAVLMAPTQVLAEQHFLVFKRWLEPLGLRLGLRTGNRREDTNGADDLFFGQDGSKDAESSQIRGNGLAGADGSFPTPATTELPAITTGPSRGAAGLIHDAMGLTPEAMDSIRAAAGSVRRVVVANRALKKASRDPAAVRAVVADSPGTVVPRNDNEPDILVGTHALLHEKTPPPRLGLVVIDEQHKFGVLQRAALSKGRKVAPDVLVMTATPIPRTLAITVYGDLDVSILDELPAGRGKIVTAVRSNDKLREAGEFVRKHLADGRQAYLVYPLIDESEKLNVKAATEAFEHWREVLKGFRCELLHGRMRPEEKDAVMKAFRDGEVHALISTTVIEVGIDVKNANLMLIENAERFGLAQLHQLRGRVGRGEHKSYCLLMVDPKAGPEAVGKLRTLEESSDGFVIAEADLRLRGAGDILGTAQSGLPPLKLGDLVGDAEWMREARTAARDLFESDPHLRRQENQRFRTYLTENRRTTLAQVS